MNDAYLLLTPILMLLIVALFGFVGCDSLFNLEEIPGKLPAPTGFKATAGDRKVTLEWDPYPGADRYLLEWRLPPQFNWEDEEIDGSMTSFPHENLTNGVTYSYTLKAWVGQQETWDTKQVEAIPGVGVPRSYVTDAMVGPPTYNDLDGWVGMGIQVGNADLTVSALGRIVAPQNTGTHDVKIVKVIDPVTRMDVATVTVDTNSAPVGDFAYAAVNPDPTVFVTLEANQHYYIVSREMLNGDNYYKSTEASIVTTDVAIHEYAVYGDLAGSYIATAANGSTYGPVDFQYIVF